MTMKKEKVVVYPYDIQFSPVLRHRSLLDGMEITGLVSPKGWGMTGMDAARADGGSSTGMLIQADFDTMLEVCDTVIFWEPCRKLDMLETVYPKMKKAIETNKNIICTFPMEEMLMKEIKEECSARGLYFKYLNSSSHGHALSIEVNTEQIVEINTPVIFVLGVNERTNKYNIQLSLRENLLKMGYKVSQVGTRNGCELVGFHSMPGFMFSDTISARNKIILFNSFIKRIEINEVPDIIIVGIPGGIMPLNKIFTHNSGTMAYEISNALVPDAAVLSLPYEDHPAEGLEVLSNIVKYRLGFEVDCFNLGNAVIDWNKSKESRILNYISTDSARVDESIGKLSPGKPVYNILSPEAPAAMAGYLVDRLASREDAQCV